MIKPELGLKRRCLTCAKPFFDLNREPIVCPSCQAVFEVVELAHSRPRQMKINPVAFRKRPMAEPVSTDMAAPPVEEPGEEGVLPPVEDEEDVQIEAIL